MKLTIKVIHEDGSSVDATASTLDLVQWEEKTNRPISDFWENSRLGDITWLAYASLVRRSQTALEYETWLETVDTIQVGDDEADPVPLESSASTGRS